MRLLLVPWLVSAYGPMGTLIFPGNAEEFSGLPILEIRQRSVRITGRIRHRILAAVAGGYSARLVWLDPGGTGKNVRIGVELEVSREEAERFLTVFKHLSKLKVKPEDAERVESDPRPEQLERLIAVKLLT